MTNWEELDKEMGGNFKDFANDGVHKVKCNGVEIKEVGTNGAVVMKFGFEETDNVQYPTADHWLTFKEGKDNWRKYHSRNLMMVLGASKDAAQKAVDMCESKSGKDAIVKAYDQTFSKLTSKKPAVEIEVYTENGYARAEFRDRSVNMNNGNKKEDKEPAKTIIEEGEDIEIDSLPF